MAVMSGKRGSLTFAGLSTLKVVSWTVDATADTVDTSVMDVTAAGAAVHWKDYVAAFKDWTATAEVINDSTDIGVAALGTEATLSMITTDGQTYSGTAICTGVSFNHDAQGAGTASLSFQGAGQLGAA